MDRLHAVLRGEGISVLCCQFERPWSELEAGVLEDDLVSCSCWSCHLLCRLYETNGGEMNALVVLDILSMNTWPLLDTCC